MPMWLHVWIGIATIGIQLGKYECIDSYDETQTGSVLIKKANHEEYSLLRELLGLPIGNAKNATATHGIKRTTKFLPKCPRTLKDVPKHSLLGYLKRCPKLQKKEYQNQERKVSEIILKSKNSSKRNYQKEKKDLIAAVNALAQLAGPLPSLRK